MSRKYLTFVLVALLALFLLGVVFFLNAFVQSGERKESNRITLNADLPDKANVVGNYIPVEGATDLWYGSPTAPVVMYLYSDLECPYCKLFDPIMNNLLTQFGDDLAVTFRHYPIPSHPAAHMEAEIVECAADQSAQLAKTLITETFKQSESSGQSFTSDEYLLLTASLGADRTALQRCFEAGVHKDAIDRSMEEAFDVDAKVTPTTFLRAKEKTVVIYGTESQAVYEQTIQHLLGI